MNYSKIEKENQKQKDRGETIKHYILGYILECVVSNDINTTIMVRRFLVHTLKIINVETFIVCLKTARSYNSLYIKGNSKNYKKFKKSIEITDFPREKQICIIKQLQKFANEYNGKYVKCRMSQNSYEDK